jgi:nucleotide-binding universal stress UspA family protein
MDTTTLIAISLGFTLVLLFVFVFASRRGVHAAAAASDEPLASAGAEDGPSLHPVRVLLAIDGSPGSVAAVNEVAHSRLPHGSAVEVVTAIHSRIPAFPDPAFALMAGKAEDLREQEKRSPDIQHHAVSRLQRHRPHLPVTTKVVEGEPAEVILREAREWQADRIVLGSHGYGPVGRAVLGSTAAAVAGAAPCSVVVARPAAAHAAQAS